MCANGEMAGTNGVQPDRTATAAVCVRPIFFHAMFLFFSNRLGCLGSLAVSAVLTLVLLLLFGVI